MFPGWFPASPSTDLATSFDEVARDMWNDLHDVNAHRDRWSETTITETVFRALRRRSLPGLLLHGFSQIEEKRTGADFELWFLEGPRGFGYRIQAKRLYFESQRYDALDHDAGAQAATLVATRSHNLEPHYCFYNYFPEESDPPNFGFLPIQLVDRSTLGITVANASRVKAECIDVRPRRKSLADLAPISLPWSWLVRPFELALLSTKEGRLMMRQAEHDFEFGHTFDRRLWHLGRHRHWWDWWENFEERYPMQNLDVLGGRFDLPSMAALAARMIESMGRDREIDQDSERFQPAEPPDYVRLVWSLRSEPNLDVESVLSERLAERGLAHLFVVGRN